MNPDLDRTEQRGPRLDDEQLGALVRGVVDEWRMPPQRLDRPTWRERTRTDVIRRRSWLARLAVPAATALVATVFLAVTAVWLTAPRRDRAEIGTSPAVSAAPSTTLGPVGTPLPRLVRNGDLPSVTQVMVQAGGHYRVADLASGTLGVDAMGEYAGPTTLVQRAGGWLCLCVKWTAVGGNTYTGLSLTLASIDAGGHVGDHREARQIDGTADQTVSFDLQVQVVDAATSVAADGKTAFFGWTARNGAAGWTSGIDVIDVMTGTVVDSKTVAAEQPAGTDGQPVSRNAPRVELSPAGDQILISSFWYVDAPNDPNPPSGIDRWIAPFDSGAVGDITTLPATSKMVCGAVELGIGFIDSNQYYLVCAGQTGGLVVRRAGLDGTAIGETAVPRTEEEFSAGSLLAHAGGGLLIWDPVAAVMSRVDLATGALTQSPAAGASIDGGALGALDTLGRRIGRWIAPSAVAKLLLQPGIVVSPDGTRVYAIGVSSPARTDRGSTGVYAFDAASLAQLGNWAPTADFSSIAVSADGRFVYAAAQAGVDAEGREFPNGSSVTVFDGSDGSVRLIAGVLGSSDLWFANPIMR